MRFGTRLLEGRFLRRLNRFAALVELKGTPIQAHVANSGRLHELFQPGNRVWLAPVPGGHRKTGYDLRLAAVGHVLVSADARMPPPLLEEAIGGGRLVPFTGYERVAREVFFGGSRLDLLLDGPPGRCVLEAKSVTLVVDGVGLFPDAPTVRGTRHLYALRDAVQQGYRAAVVFVVQREDVLAFAPHDAADPSFGAALRQVVGQGVEVYAYACRVSQREMRVESQLPVLL